jgi:DNA-binding transcriptional LysR family regulator
MDFVELQIFKAVAEQGGITKAAASLHRVQSNVTTRVKQLEERVGAKLFHRKGRRLILSSEGKVLLAYADRMLRLSNEAQAALKGNTPQGIFRIGSLESTAATRLPPILSRFHLRYPAVRLEMLTGTSGALVGKVLSEEVEAAFVAEPFSAAELETELAFMEELVLITPRSYPRSIKSPKDIGPSTVLAFTTGCSYRRRLEAWLGRSNVCPERVMEYGSYHAIVACAAAGTGIAVVPRSVLRTVGAEGQVAVHALPASVASAKTMLVWRKGHQSSALDALRQEMGRKQSSAR